MPEALPGRQAAKLRKHTLQLRTPSERAQRREASLSAWTAVSPALTTRPITPGQTLAAAGIDDARQAEYQRKMSALLAGQS
jgi:hypothetical protein